MISLSNISKLYNPQRTATTGKSFQTPLALVRSAQYPAHIEAGKDAAEREFALESLELERQQSELDRELAADLSSKSLAQTERLTANQLAVLGSQHDANLSLAREQMAIAEKQASTGNLIDLASLGFQGYKVAKDIGWIGGTAAKTAAATTGAATTGGTALAEIGAAAGPASAYGTNTAVAALPSGAPYGAGEAVTAATNVAGGATAAEGVSGSAGFDFGSLMTNLKPMAGMMTGFMLGRMTQSRGIGIAGGAVAGFAAGGPVGAIVGAIAGFIGGSQKDSPPPKYEDYVKLREGVTYGVSPGGPIRASQMYPNTKETYVAMLNKTPWPGQQPTGSVSMYNEPTVSAFGGSRSATNVSRPGGLSTIPYRPGQSVSFKMPQYAIPDENTYNVWRDAQIAAMG